ncbi:MAG: orotate phosphoribosyltransferase [Deltaproteobacteria bacterium]|nr:orotate phosphoribosyltransferase [Deltaproteobacteria bacterium]
MLARLLELLRRDAYIEGQVELASGAMSDFYLDCRRVSLLAEGHFLIGSIFSTLITRCLPDVRAVGGMSMGADPLASATATISALGPHPLDAFYVRKEAKVHGKKRSVESPSLPANTAAVVVEDVVTSGLSALQAVERAREAGLVPRAVLVLVDREEGGAQKIESELPLLALYHRRDF